MATILMTVGIALAEGKSFLNAQGYEMKFIGAPQTTIPRDYTTQSAQDVYNGDRLGISEVYFYDTLEKCFANKQPGDIKTFSWKYKIKELKAGVDSYELFWMKIWDAIKSQYTVEMEGSFLIQTEVTT